MDEIEQTVEATEELARHPAFLAWRRLDAHGRPPDRIDYLRGNLRHRIIFRLHGAGDTSLIAKGSGRPDITVEQQIYEHVLSRLPVSAPRYYGFVDGLEDLSWLFLEDVGDTEFVPSNADHRAAATKWLAQLHATAPDVISDVHLPAQGPDRYLDHLQGGRARILSNLEHDDLTDEDLTMLQAVISLCDETERRWQNILALCEGLPQTMVHGDFQPKNIRVQGTGGALRIYVFDWEKAGWGIPGPDLAPNIYRDVKQVDLTVYRRLVRGTWPDLDRQSIGRMADVGHLFRLLASIDWASQSLGFPRPEKPVAQLQIYLGELDWIVHERSLGSAGA